MGAGTAGSGGGTRRCQRCSRPISGPPAAVSAPGLLVSYGTTDHGKPTALGRIRSQSLYSCLHNFLGEVRLANTLRPGGGPGKGREPRRLSPFRGRRQLIPESRYQLLAAQPDPTYVHPPVRVGSIEAAHWASPRCHRRAPLPSLRSIGRLPAPMGGGEGRHIWSEFAAGSSRACRFRGGNDGLGSR